MTKFLEVFVDSATICEIDVPFDVLQDHIDQFDSKIARLVIGGRGNRRGNHVEREEGGSGSGRIASSSRWWKGSLSNHDHQL